MNYAIKREKEKCWRQAIIAYTRCIVMCADKVQKLTSKRAQQKLMGWTYKCMEKCAYIENYVLFLEQKERYEQSKLQTQNVPFNQQNHGGLLSITKRPQTSILSPCRAS